MKTDDLAKTDIGPFIVPFDRVGGSIEAPGWNQSYASPYIQPRGPVTSYTGRTVVDVTRGRHQYRTQPRPLGPAAVVPSRLLPMIEQQLSPSFVPGSRPPG